MSAVPAILLAAGVMRAMLKPAERFIEGFHEDKS